MRLVLPGMLVWVSCVSDQGLNQRPTTVDGEERDNTPPTISVILTPDAPTTNEVVTAEVVATDPDGDPLEITYQWTVDGLILDATGPTLDGATHFDRDEWIEVAVVAHDGIAPSPEARAVVVAANTPPGPPVVQILPEDAADLDPLWCSVVAEAVDVDGDLVTYSYRWERDHIAYDGILSTTTWRDDTVPVAGTAMWEHWSCIAEPHDGTEPGPTATAAIYLGDECADPNGDLYTVGDSVFAIDRTTGDRVAVATAPPMTFNTVAIRTTDGLSLGHSSDAQGLFHLDLCTGAYTELADMDQTDGCGMAFDGDGRLFLAAHGSNSLLELDPATGAVLAERSMNVDIGFCGLAYDCTTDTLWGTDHRNDRLWTIDVDTGDITFVWNLPFDLGELVGLAVDADGVAWLVDDDYFLWSFDVNTGVPDRVGLTQARYNDLTMHTCP